MLEYDVCDVNSEKFAWPVATVGIEPATFGD
jgi:hypothetical protein